MQAIFRTKWRLDDGTKSATWIREDHRILMNLSRHSMIHPILVDRQKVRISFDSESHNVGNKTQSDIDAPMTEYIMINHGAGTAADWDQYFKMLRDQNHMIGGSALNQGISVKDAVFSNAITPTITGYLLIQAESLEKAKEIMALSPVHKTGGTVELFTLVKS